MPRDVRQELASRGYEYLGGTGSQARSIETGMVISRRQWEQLLGTPLPKVPARHMNRYNSIVTTFRNERRPDMSRRAIRAAPEFRFAVNELREIGAAERRAAARGEYWVVDGRPPEIEARLRAALVALGRRNPDWDMAVGESPT